jgi:AAHS family 4-hydroxybenzoate transporter-like MFS transporter
METPGTVCAKVDLVELVDNGRVGQVQWGVFGLCLLSLIMDGFDTQALGYTAPAIIRDWGVPGSALGPVFAAGNFGVLLGSIVFSMVADRVGRRPVIIAATFFFAVMTILTARVSSVEELLIYRFIAGIGLGSIIPQATSLVSEFSPKRLRTTMVMVITVGFTAGAAFGGFVAAALIPTFGWRSVFYFGGTIPLFVAVAMLVALPESLQFMALGGRRYRASLVTWLKRMDPRSTVDAHTEFVVLEETGSGGVPIAHLFYEGRALTTLLLWVVNFMNLLNLYSLASWLPTVVTSAGYPQQTAVLVGTILQVGGTIGTFGLAWLVARNGFIPMLATTFAVACVSIALIGQPGLSLTMLFVVVFIAGWCVVGSQPGLNALAASYYPTYIRSTGVGAGLGVGRAGAIVGPLIGGYFLAQQWSPREIFLAAAVPAFISVLVMVTLRWVIKMPTSATSRATEI